MLCAKHFAVVAIFMVPVVLGGAPADAAKICKNLYTSNWTGPLPTKGTAEATSAVAWSNRVISTYGLKWSNWGNATNRKYSCKVQTTAVGVNAWRCRARAAKPCIHQ